MAILFDTYSITFAEVPDEISLCFSITNCQGRCKGCHSPHLRENAGSDLFEVLPHLLQKYKRAISCVCFLGEGNDTDALTDALKMCRDVGAKTALYSGRRSVSAALYELLDYVKVGDYQEDKGALTSPTTNQRMYSVVRNGKGEIIGMDDITYKFWRGTKNTPLQNNIEEAYKILLGDERCEHSKN